MIHKTVSRSRRDGIDSANHVNLVSLVKSVGEKGRASGFGAAPIKCDQEPTQGRQAASTRPLPLSIPWPIGSRAGGRVSDRRHGSDRTAHGRSNGSLAGTGAVRYTA